LTIRRLNLFKPLKTKRMEILSLTELIQIIWKNFRTLVIIGIITIIVSAIVALMLPVYYQSMTTIFPVKLAQAPVNETAFRRGNISDFGETGEAEQVLEILNSNTLMERVIDKFDLYTHYEIPRDLPAAKTFVFKTYQGNVDIKRTKFNSIQITVKDKNAIMAADMANAIADYLDTLKYEIVLTRANELIGNLEKQYDKQQAVIDKLKSELDSLTRMGIMSQFQRGYLLEAFAQSSGAERQQLRKLVDDNIRLGEEFDRVERLYERELDNLLLINKYLVQTRADAELQFSQKFVVDKAEPAERKAYPIRWLIVLLSLMSVMLISIGFLLAKKRWPEYKQSIVS
jgi:capsular polysaccharide biosynthesis protein